MTIDGIVGMLATRSNAITASEHDRAAGLAQARAALERQFPGVDTIEVPMMSACWRTNRTAYRP